MNKAIFPAALLCGFTAMAQNAPEYDRYFEYAVFHESDDSLNYRIMLPDHYDTTQSYPLVLFLHGRGESGSDNEGQLTHGAALFVNNRSTYPAIVVFPQCALADYWAVRTVEQIENRKKYTFPQREEPNPGLGMVDALIDQLIARYPVDTSRIYLAGLSMGGMATFELVSRRPHTFAAAIAICGGGNEEAAASYAKHTPFWIFHGTADDVIPPSHSIAMEKAIRRAGGDPKLTLYDGVNHNSWDNAFAEPDLLKWLFSHSK